MVNCSYLFALVCMVMPYITSTSAFFLNWGSSEPTAVKSQQIQPHPWPVSGYYQQRYFQPGQYQYAVNSENGASMPMPAVPIQVPLQAQLSPAAGVQNVQLVPCVCPMSTDFEQQGDNNGPVFVSQLKAPQH